MRECQPLNLHEPTNAERRMPGKTYTTYLGTGRAALCSLDDVKGRAQPHDETYTRLRSVHSVASQLLIEANRDRAASLNIALRAAQTANMQSALNSGQFPEGNASVSRRDWQGEGFERSHHTTPSCKPTSLSSG